MNKITQRKRPAKTRMWFKITAACTAVLGAIGLPASQAGSLDYFGQPPVTDPSAYTNPPLVPTTALQNLFTLPETNRGALELPAGVYGDKYHPARRPPCLPPSAQGSFNYPHQRQAEPALRRPAIHPADAALRGVRPGTARPRRSARRAVLPGPHGRPGTGAGPGQRSRERAGRRGPGGLPGPAGICAVPDAVLEHHGPEPVESGDRSVPRPPAQASSRRRTAAGQRAGPTSAGTSSFPRSSSRPPRPAPA